MLSTKQPQFTTSNWGGGDEEGREEGRGEELWKGLWNGKRDMKRVHCISKWRNTHTHTHTHTHKRVGSLFYLVPDRCLTGTRPKLVIGYRLYYPSSFFLPGA